jgi:hypothetical protein
METAQSNGSRSGADGKSLPQSPVTLTDVMQALDLTEARVRWLEGNGTLPRAERDPEGRLLWNIDDLRAWSKSEAGQKMIASLR